MSKDIGLSVKLSVDMVKDLNSFQPYREDVNVFSAETVQALKDVAVRKLLQYSKQYFIFVTVMTLQQQ